MSPYKIYTQGKRPSASFILGTTQLWEPALEQISKTYVAVARNVEQNILDSLSISFQGA